MKNEYRYKFDKSSKKHICPECGKKRFVRYIDTKTGSYLPKQYGKCDRADNCSYHLSPYLDGYAKQIWLSESSNNTETQSQRTRQKKRAIPPPQQIPQTETVYFDFETFKQTLEPERYEINTFIQNLFHSIKFPFELSEVTKVIQLYKLGTVAKGYRQGATTFPFIDINGNVRAIQVKQFDTNNHTTGTDFLHSIIEKHYQQNSKALPGWLTAYNKQEKRVSCLFGEQILKQYPNSPIALVEAPKTAIYGWLYFHRSNTILKDCIWLAVYNKSSFTIDRLKVLKGRFVYVFPDLSKDGNTFKEWEQKAITFETQLPGTKFLFSDLLEQLAPEADKQQGFDLADFLINLNWKDFLKVEQPSQSNELQLFDNWLKANPQGGNFVLDNQTFRITPKAKPTPQNQKREVSEASEAPKTKIFFPTKQVQNWSNEIAELESYFAGLTLPKQRFQLNKYTTITDLSLFIQSHFEAVKANNGNSNYLPFLDRLKELKQQISGYSLQI